MAEDLKKIHVWAVIRLYQPNFSGAAIQAQQVYKRLVQQGFDVTVITSANRAARHLAGQTVQTDGVTIRYLPVLQTQDWTSVSDRHLLRKLLAYGKRLFSDLLFDLQTAIILWREGHTNESVLFHSSNNFTLIPVLAARKKGIRSVIQMTLLHADDPAAIIKQRGWFLKHMRLDAFRKADSITGSSSAQIESCLSMGLRSNVLFQIPYGVDLQTFQQLSDGEQITLRRRLGLNPEGRFIIFVGDVIARKGIDILVKAFLEIQSVIKQSELLIVGPYDLADFRYNLVHELKRELESACCTSRVHWVGRVDNVNEYMQASDIFCFPTRNEGFGIVIIEAMASGLPVVVSRLEGITTDIVLNEAEGVLIAEDDPAVYADILLSLLKMPEQARAMGGAARLRVETVFSMEQVAELHAQLFRSLANNEKE